MARKKRTRKIEQKKEYAVVLNLTQHKATKDQKEAGVIDLPESYRKKIMGLLTFNEIPDCDEIHGRAIRLVDVVEEFLTDEMSPVRDEFMQVVANHYEGVEDLGLAFMIGGAPFFMSELQRELNKIGTPLYAFSKREVIETVNDNGEVLKSSVFRHIGFVRGC
jgi:hypothetical protein